LCPTEDKIFDTFKPAFEKWTPKSAFKGGSWGKAFNGGRMELSFTNGSSIQFKTYKQDASTLGGAALHFVGYDEPPPKTHRSECKMRLVDYQGFEMFAMTPIRANTSWIRRDLWRNREAPNLTVIKASIHDNPLLSREAIEEALSVHPEHERKAREFGDFMDLGGMIYPDFDRCVAAESFPLDFIRGLDIVVGIDPGIRNAGFAWVGFDKDLTAYVFNEGMLQDTEAHGYAAFIKAENSRLGLRSVQYVCDPAARSRGQVNAETVMMALSKEGIHAVAGQNSHDAGFDQLRSRMRLDRFKVDPQCFGIRDEADDYAAKEPGDDDDDSHLDPVSNRFHRLDALRYAVMERFWDPVMEENAPKRMLGFVPGRSVEAGDLVMPKEAHPMGGMF
jgi:phage terminase large subunit-like protein